MYKFYKLNKKFILESGMQCDYCKNLALGTFVNEEDEYDYIDVCEECYEKYKHEFL